MSSSSQFVIVLTVPNPPGNPIDFTTAETSLVELSWTAVMFIFNCRTGGADMSLLAKV